MKAQMSVKVPHPSKSQQSSDLYGDYNVATDVIASSVAATAGKKGSTGAGTALRLNPAKPPGTAAKPGTSMRPPTGSVASGDKGRPMTSVKGAGYTSQGKAPTNKTSFDPLGQNTALGPAAPLVPKSSNSPEMLAKEYERQVNKLIEESAIANGKKDFTLALEKAKEAGKRERLLCRHREKNGHLDQVNHDLTYAVCFNLALQYHALKMYSEALNTYTIVVKNKQYAHAGRLRVNMGNIYYEQKKYPSAIKMYRMAMDLIGSSSREMRFRIMRNIGHSFVRLGQFQDAIQSYEAIMESSGDPQTGFNLVICYYALGDKEKMRRGFMQLLSVKEFAEDVGEPEVHTEEEKDKLVEDDLRVLWKARRQVTHRFVRMAAKLIAPVIERDIAEGYDWVIEYLNTPRRPSSDKGEVEVVKGFPAIAMELAIAKGIAYLKRQDYKMAVEVFKSYEKKDELIDQAATNLSFLYFLEGRMKEAEKYAEMAVKADRYNAKALVNRANYIFNKLDTDKAKEMYWEAIGVETDCVEAIYNLGLTNKKLGLYDDALQAFKKLHRIVPKDPQVIYQIANLYDLVQDTAQAAKWFKILHGAVPSDPKVLARLGTLYNREGDETQAFHNYSDSYNCYPVNMEVISWLGVWYVKGELYEEALPFFERASEIEPGEIKWHFMVASCYRRMGSLQQALDVYKKIHKQDPDNIDCLKYLCTICKDMNDQEYDEYNKQLHRLERAEKATESKYVKDDVGPAEKGPSHSSSEMDNKFRAEVGEKDQALSLAAMGKKENADEDWGDDDLGDDLLPL